MVKIEFDSWSQVQQWAKPIRLAVFVAEQGIDEAEEWDADDAISLHGVAWVDDRPVGCVRLLPQGKIGRLAVLPDYRGLGIGRQLMRAALAQARQAGLRRVRISAQVHALGLYEALGFVADGEPHTEVGIAHQWMCIDLD